MSNGLFIVLDGIDGSGTTTQAQILAGALRSQGREVVLTREPSTGPVGLLIRQQLSAVPGVDPLTLALLFAADRAHHWHTEIQPSLARGAVVISDRYILSSFAYQGLHLDAETIRLFNGMGPGGHYHPADMTFFFDIAPEKAFARVQSRNGVMERFEVLDLQKKIAENYLNSLRLIDPEKERLVRIDAERDIEEVAQEIWAAVLELERTASDVCRHSPSQHASTDG